MMAEFNPEKDTIKFPSFINVFEVPSSSSRTGDSDRLHQTETKIVYEIIDKIFDDQTGLYEASSSYCSSVEKRSSECSWDRRLRYWRNMVEERKRIAEFVRKQTGKKRGEVLFNRRSTIDERDKHTVQRLLDYAERVNPDTLVKKQKAHLPERWPERWQPPCCWRPEVDETLPKAERDQKKIVEIVGLPEVAKEEQLGKRKERGSEKKSNWLRSKVLEERVCERAADIERVVEFYPDIDKLQVVGTSMFKQPERQLSDIELVAVEDTFDVSSDSACGDLRRRDTPPPPEPLPDFAVRINDQVFKLPEKRSSKNLEIEVRFDAEPFERYIRHAMRLENTGKKILNGEWERRDYYAKNTLNQPADHEFYFNHKPFRLVSGESMDIYVLYQPRRVAVAKERWLLKIDPPFFCRNSDSVVLRLNGKCRPPHEYVEKVRLQMCTVVGKSNRQMMDRLATGLGSTVPLLKPDEQVCPYRRALSECELFECFNAGYRCERYHDLELLKDIHKRAKKPRHPPWDLHVDSLKDAVMRLPVPEERALLFNELVGVLQQMRGPSVDLEVRITATEARDRSRFLYVRGMMCSRIEEWEEMSFRLEAAFLKPATQRYYENLGEAEEEAGDEVAEAVTGEPPDAEAAAQDVLDLLMVDEEAVRNYLTKKIRRRKAFRDSFYVQTYSHLCNMCEDLVSVIESTEVM